MKTSKLKFVKSGLPFVILCFSTLSYAKTTEIDTVKSYESISQSQVFQKIINEMPLFKVDDNQELIEVAQKSKRKKKKPKKSRRKKSASSKKSAQSAVQVGAGIVSGVKTANAETPFVLVGDYKSPLSKNLFWSAGGSYTYYQVVEDIFAADFAIIAFGGGGGYQYPLSPKMWLEGSSQLIFAMYTARKTTDVNGDLIEDDVSKSSLGLSINAAFHFSFGGMSVGPEVRYPIMFDADVAESTGVNLLAVFQLEL